MNFIGVDLHKKSITICVMNEKLKVVARKTLPCNEPDQIVEFFRQFGPFKVVVEATASYLWFVELLEPLAEKIVLANPRKLKAFIAKAPKREAEARQIVKTAPGVGAVTAEVVLSELGDVSRFRNAKTVCAYAGLVPVVRQSGGKGSKDLHITKDGSGLLRWALVESAWRLVNTSPKWTAVFSRLRKRSGNKRAIVAVARKLLCVLYAMLKTSTPYKVITT